MSGTKDELLAGAEEALHRLARRFMRPRHKSADIDLTLGQLDCLRLIGRMGLPSMSELSAELHLKPSTATGMVDALVRRGKIERVQDPGDRRVVRVQLTEESRKWRERHHRHARRKLRGLLTQLDDDELQQVSSALALLSRKADEMADGN